MSSLPGFTFFSGTHPETAALRNALAYSGIVAPHTNQPYTEAMLLGIGGGLGAGYIMFEFKEHGAKVLILGFRKNWQYSARFVAETCDRVGVHHTLHETGGRGTAAKQLTEALASGKPTIAWVDPAHMPYLQLPDALKGHTSHLVLVCGLDNGTVTVADLAKQPFSVPLDVFADARARIGSHKNRLIIVNGVATAIDLPDIVLAGIRDCVDHLSEKSDSFSLPTLRKWAKMMVDAKNAKGWLKLFKDGRGLYSILKSMFEGIELTGTGGGALRPLYADFLDEAAVLLSNPALSEAAARYRQLGQQWTTLADAVLPDAIAPLAETRHLLRERDALLMAQGDSAANQMRPLTDRLEALHAENRAFPLNFEEIGTLLSGLSEQLMAIYDAEVEAVNFLRESV